MVDNRILEERQQMVEYQGEKFKRSLEYFDERRTELEDKVLAGDADPLELVIADKKTELYFIDHDSTGALQGVLLGKDLASNFQDRGLELDAEGKLIPNDDDQNHYLGMVTLAELDRMNAEGGHHGGNRALASTVRGIESVLYYNLSTYANQYLPKGEVSSLYNIYHTRGGDFAYTLDLVNFPPEIQREIVENISNTIVRLKATHEERGFTTPTSEGSSFGTTVLRRDHAITMFNTAQERLREQDQALLSKEDVLRSVIGLWRRSAETDLELEWRVARGQRVVDLLERGDVQAASQQFELYFKKFTEGSELAEFSAFTLPEGDAETRHAAAERLMEKLYQIIEDRVGEELASSTVGEGPGEHVMADIIWGDELQEVDEELSPEDRRYLETLPTQPLAAIKDRKPNTIATKFINGFNTTVDRGTAVADRVWKGEVTDEDVVVLYQLMQMGNFPKTVEARGTEIPIVTSLQELISDIREGNVDEKDFGRIDLLVRAAEREHMLAESKVDSLTGLPNRAEYILKLKEKLEKSSELPPDESVRVLFVDLGFLKYLNRGGRDVGNLAVQRTAEILEQAMRRANITDGDAFRYAGDEYTCVFTGSHEEEMRLIDAIEELKEENKELKRTEKSGSLYRPQKLEINYGTADHRIAEDTVQSLAERRLLPPAVMQELDSGRRGKAYYEYLVNVQTRIADLGIEAQKAYSRYQYLFDEIRATIPEEFPEEMELIHKQTESLVNGSQKAVFGMSLRELHEMAYSSAYDYGTPEGNRNLLTFIDEKKGKTVEDITDNRKLEDAVVLTYVRENSLRRHIASLEAKVATLTAEHERDRVKNQELMGILTQLEQQLEGQNTKREEQVRAELESHAQRELDILEGQQELSQLHELRQELAEKRQGLKVVEKPQ